MCIIETGKIIHSEKTLSWFSLELLKTIIAHDTIQCLKNIVHYLSMKMPDILVEMIYLKPFSSLKWDGVYKKGTSWAGPRP